MEEIKIIKKSPTSNDQRLPRTNIIKIAFTILK